MGFFTETRPSRVMAVLALAGLVIATAFVPVVDLDIWWHLATGWVISTFHQIPKNDLFSSTAFGAPWVNHEWLFQLAAWLLYSAGGVAALTILKLVVATAIAVVLFHTIAFLSDSPSAALWGTAAALWAFSNRVMERPFLIGLLMLALFALILYRFARSGSRFLWLLPLLQILWTNTHGGALFGVQVVFAFALGETLQAFAQPRIGGPEPIPAERRRHLWLAALACLAASVITPWGIDTLIFPFEHLQMKAILLGTSEWLPMLHPSLDRVLPQAFALVCLAGVLLAFIANARRVRFSHLLLVLLVSSLLLQSHRFIPDFIIVAVPILCAQIAEIVRTHSKQRVSGWAPTWINLAAVFALSALAMVHGVPVERGGGWIRLSGFGATLESAPTHLVDFLERHNIHGRGFNDMGMGGYLIFRRWPGERVFIDGRTPVFGDSFYEEFVDVFRNSRNFEEFDQRYGFDYAVFPGYQITNSPSFQKYLWQHPHWRLVYMERDGAVYLKDVPKFRPLIQKLALKTNPLLEAIREDEERQRKALEKEALLPAAPPSPVPTPFRRR